MKTWRIVLHLTGKEYIVDAETCDEAIGKALDEAGIKTRCGSTAQVINKTKEICKKTIKAIEADIVELYKELGNINANNLERENMNKMKGIIDPFDHYNIGRQLTQSITYAEEIIEDLEHRCK